VVRGKCPWRSDTAAEEEERVLSVRTENRSDEFKRRKMYRKKAEHKRVGEATSTAEGGTEKKRGPIDYRKNISKGEGELIRGKKHR